MLCLPINPGLVVVIVSKESSDLFEVREKLPSVHIKTKNECKSVKFVLLTKRAANVRLRTCVLFPPIYNQRMAKSQPGGMGQ